MQKEILIVEDDVDIANMLDEMLRREGYGVLHAYSGTEALLVLAQTRPDLVLLDLMLPGLSGEEVLPCTAGIPVIVLSAKPGVDDKVRALLGGAVDYVTKPFHMQELLARITVQLRRAAQTGAAPVLAYDGLNLHTDTHIACIGESEMKLTRTEYAILKTLMQSPEQVIAKSILLDRIGEDTPDCTESSLKTHISHLRKKLRAAGGKEYIDAVWGIGFRLKSE